MWEKWELPIGVPRKIPKAKNWLLQSQAGGCGTSLSHCTSPLTEGLIVKPNMLREQKSRDHWRGSDVVVPLEMVSFFLIHFQLLSTLIFTLSQRRWNDVAGC